MNTGARAENGGTLRFDGRVAVITGAGRGIGREHALLLADRGARIVVNGRSTDVRVVVDEIREAGGHAVPCVSDIGSVDGARAVVQAALESFGRIDIVVNNAAPPRPRKPFADWSREELDSVLDVTVGGTWSVTQAAWPHLLAQGYGRVVVTLTASVLGTAGNTVYATTKAALLGLARTLAVEGTPHRVFVNGFIPGAFTEAVASRAHHDDSFRTWMAEVQPAWAAATPLAWLVHESCTANGEVFRAAGRRFSRLFVSESRGYVAEGDGYTPESVRDHMPAVMDEQDSVVHPDGASVSKLTGEMLGSERR